MKRGGFFVQREDLMAKKATYEELEQRVKKLEKELAKRKQLEKGLKGDI
jgi:BMFP domain-containing protein YqiC